MVLDTTETRLNRVENDIETLRTTQANILDHLDSYSKTLNETRDIAAENRDRLDSIENRQKQMEERQNEMANDLKRRGLYSKVPNVKASRASPSLCQACQI